MILSFKMQNYLSFKDEVEFSFEATKDRTLEDYHVVTMPDKTRILKLGIIYGANASGKSNVLSGFNFVINFIQNDDIKSKDENIKELIPFKLDNKTRKESSKFELVFYVKDIKYKYNLEVFKNIVLLETLYKYKTKKPTKIFERRYENEKSVIEFGNISITDLEENQLIINTIPNISVFSSYRKLNLNIEDFENINKWILNLIFPKYFDMDTKNICEKMLSDSLELKNDVLEYIRVIYTDIKDITFRKEKMDLDEEYIKFLLKENDIKTNERIKSFLSEKIETTFTHRVHDGEKEEFFELDLKEQSQGTQRLFELSVPLLLTKEKGILCIDEIESKLHPLLIEYIIKHFIKNSEKSQLLATTHYDGILEYIKKDDFESFLRYDNIWFTEKKDNGATELYSLSDFNNLNRLSSIRKAYRIGNFGAKPNL